MANGEAQDPGRPDSDSTPAALEDGRASTERRGVPTEIVDVSFPVSVRGYDRGAVDAYLSRVREFFQELEATRSPEAAVKHALDQVGEQTKGMLVRAGETAEQITLAARQDAEETSARAKRDAENLVANADAEAAEILDRSKAEAEATVAQARSEAAEHLRHTQDEAAALREAAEARVRELDADTETIRQERRQLLHDLRQIATRVEDVASAADARFPPPEGAEQTEEGDRQAATAGEAEASDVAEPEVPTADGGKGPASRG